MEEKMIAKTIEGENGYWERYDYDENERVRLITNSDGVRVQWLYEKNVMKVRYSDSNNEWIEIRYDNFGEIIDINVSENLFKSDNDFVAINVNNDGGVISFETQDYIFHI